MIIKEFFCADHGEFEGSHAICPHMGCDSHDVIREIRTAPKLRSASTSRTDADVRLTAQMYGQSDFKTATREGDSSKAHNQSAGVLWGAEGEKLIGKPLTQAHVPQSFDVKTKDGVKRWTDHGGMRTAANEIGITQKVLPNAEMRVPASDKEARRKIVQA